MKKSFLLLFIITLCFINCEERLENKELIETTDNDNLQEDSSKNKSKNNPVYINEYRLVDSVTLY